MNRRYDGDEGDPPRSLERFVEIEDIPGDLVDQVIHDYVVKIECAHCAAKHHYVNDRIYQTIDCKNPDCDHQIILQ